MDKKLITVIVIVLIVSILCICGLGYFGFASADPSTSFRDTRNRQRESNVMEISNAISQYFMSEDSIESLLADISDCDDGYSDTIVLDTLLAPIYLPYIPTDPHNDNSSTSGYVVCKENMSIEIAAPLAEDTEITHIFELISY